MREFNLKRDKTVRYKHPFTKEKFIVCSLEGFAQVLACPRGLIWYESEQTCGEKDENLYKNLLKQCKWLNGSDTLLPYPYSMLKFVRCNDDNSLFNVEECPKTTPFYCSQKKSCVKNFFVDCLM